MSAPKLTGLIILLLIIALVVTRWPTRTDKYKQGSKIASSSIKYLPLGDSYTIGQSVREQERWPNQLAARLNAVGQDVQIVDNPSVTGYTTQDLIDRELPLVKELKPQFVTILIGVNDYVQGVSLQTFQKNLILMDCRIGRLWVFYHNRG